MVTHFTFCKRESSVTVTVSRTSNAPIDTLKKQLDDPAVASALGDILEHADLLAILVVGLDGFISRSEAIGDELASSFGDLRGLAEGTGLAGIDASGIIASIKKLSSAMPALTHMVDSGLLDSLVDSVAQPAAVEQLGHLTKGVADGLSAPPVEIGGAFSLLRQLKDPEVSRGLSFGLTMLKSIGSELNSQPTIERK